MTLHISRNQPLAPSDRRSATDLVSNKDKQYISLNRQAEPGISGLKKTLVAGWKEVDTLTRKR
jgi:putative membrane protein